MGLRRLKKERANLGLMIFICSVCVLCTHSPINFSSRAGKKVIDIHPQLYYPPRTGLHLYSPPQTPGLTSNITSWPFGAQRGHFHAPPPPSLPGPRLRRIGNGGHRGLPQGSGTPSSLACRSAGGEKGLTRHLWGRSPVCTRRCFCRWASWVKLFWHRAH